MLNLYELPLSNNNIPLIALAIPLCASQLMGTRHMRGRIQRLLRDPHVWLPWKNRTPWKNPIQSWWHNPKPFILSKPWQNSNPWHPATGQTQPFWKSYANLKASSQNATTSNITNITKRTM